MKPEFRPWHLLLLILGGWISRKQQDAVEYLLAENRILREKLEKKRILLDDDQRRRLAARGKILGRKIKEECLGRMIFFGERTLQVAAAEFLRHSHAERNHQGLGSRQIEPGEKAGRATGKIACRERLGGLLRYYCREAA